MTEHIEIMARALWIHENSATISDAASVWDHPESVEHALYWTQKMADNHPAYRDKVCAAIAALADAGFVIMPITPNEDMVRAGNSQRGHMIGTPHRVWSAMIEAGRVKA